MKLLTATFAVLASTLFLVLGGCSNVPLIRAVQLDRLEPFSEAKAKLPPLAPDSIRLYIYRPQGLAGMAGNAIVVVDGNRMGNPARPTVENLLLPGAVFVVDTPARRTRVWWEQTGQGDESGKAIELTPESSRAWYLRWNLKPTYGYLELVQEQQALPEIEPLRMSGYVDLLPK
jgi:hypothetical protein